MESQKNRWMDQINKDDECKKLKSNSLQQEEVEKSDSDGQ